MPSPLSMMRDPGVASPDATPDSGRARPARETRGRGPTGTKPSVPAGPAAPTGSWEDPGPASAGGPVQAVLGYARGCGISEIAPFVRSLRAVFPGRVILVVDRRPTLLAWLATHRVQTVVAFPSGDRRHFGNVTARFAAFAEILHLEQDIAEVLAAPVRNVVFQQDPFGPHALSLRIYPEAGQELIVDRVFGHMPGRLGDRGLTARQTRRACAAIALITGPAGAVARLSQTVVKLRSIPPLGLFGAAGSDRAAREVVAGLNLEGRDGVADDDRVTTLASTLACRVGLRGGLIVHPDLTARPVVHGYDRIGQVHDHVQRSWGLPGRSRGFAGRLSGPGQKAGVHPARARPCKIGEAGPSVPRGR